ncbi:hypothetical protein [Streptomyces sp. NPDC052114]|uniref:hypothetical protein n=1 Tax=unclassified Streptomyces TaxID=2593676 RepID=UPI003439672D
MTLSLPQRFVEPGHDLPAVGDVAFVSRAEIIDRADVAPDMGDLAARVRVLMNLQGGRSSLLPLGGRLFDVVVTAGGGDARAIVRLLDDAQVDGCGPVIDDPERSWLYWLVPPGSSDRWAPHRFGTCLGHPHQISLPPPDQTDPPGAYWLRPLNHDRRVPTGPLRDYLDRFQPTPVPHVELLAATLRTP